VRSDVEALELTGTAVPLLEGVKVDGIHPDFALTPDGTLLMMTGAGVEPGPNQEVVWISREGVARPVDPDWPMANARNMGWAISPDGTRLAIGLSNEEGNDIWIKELDDGPLLRLTYDPAEDARPRWSADGESVFFLSRRREQVSELYVQRADGAGDPLPILVERRPMFDTDLSPDGAWLVARTGGQQNQTGGRDIMAYHLEGDSTEVPILTSDYDEVSPKLSPDGRWLAFASRESGDWEIYVRPFPNVQEGRWVVSRGGGVSPMWAHSGREVFYISPAGEMMVATVETGDGSFHVAERRVLFDLPAGTVRSPLTTPYDITPDDQRFIMVRLIDSAVARQPAPLILVENWLEEVKERMGSKNR
jgi:dipeptidyl aminopeptidase/acylaminoacyl peptidase